MTKDILNESTRPTDDPESLADLTSSRWSSTSLKCEQCIIQPVYGKIRRVPESPVAFTCVKLWEESVLSEWIHWEEWFSASEKRLKQVTAVRWLGVRASLRTMHSGTAYPSLHGTVKPLFEHVWMSIRTEIQYNTISFLLHSLHRQCLNRIMSDNNEGALLKNEKWVFYSNNARTRGGRCRPFIRN